MNPGIVASVELLAHLTPQEIDFMVSISDEESFSAGDIIFEEDTPATHFHVISAGKVGLELVSPRRRPIVIQTLGPGDLIGLSWFFPPHTWAWRARALDATTTIAFDAAAVRAEAQQDPNLAQQILHLVAREAVKRLHAARTQLLDLYEFPR